MFLYNKCPRKRYEFWLSAWWLLSRLFLNSGSQEALLEMCGYVHTHACLQYLQTYFRGSEKLENFAVYPIYLIFIKNKKYKANQDFFFFFLTQQIGLPSPFLIVFCSGFQPIPMALQNWNVSNAKAKKQLAMTDYFWKVNCKTI